MDFLVIDDDKVFREATCFLIEDEGHFAEGMPDGAAALRRVQEDRFDAALLDLYLGAENGLDLLPRLLAAQPRLPVVLFTAAGSVKTAVEAMRRGAVDYLEKPFTREQFHAVLARLQRFQQLGRHIEQLERDVRETRAQQPEAVFDFETPVMRDVMRMLDRAAPTPASILILGESGTGKSVVAREIHARSHLAAKPFITVSCPSLSRELLESELFGHVKGSFTGAVRDHWGKVKAAEGGTLFLDEIGDLPAEIQPKLLRLLQEREYERLGENVTRRADLRLITATNRDLRRRVAEGTFREDLFYRLNVIAVTLPPLRDRPGDLLRFAEHYLRHFAAQCGRPAQRLGDPAATRLRAHAWPGNLRELRNTVERASILATGDEITPDELPIELHAGAATATPGSPASTQPASTGLVTLEKLEEQHLRRVLAATTSLAEAAQLLGIDQATLYRKRKRLGLG